MQRSTVKWFDAKKGYGFIDHPEEGDDVFVHYSQINTEKDFKTLRTGQQVAFELSDGPKGLHALEVKPLEEETGEAAQPEEEVTEEAASASANGSSGAEQQPAEAEQHETEEHEDEWESEWDEEEWTDEHGNPPDPMAGPSF